MAHPPPRAPATTSALIVVRDLALGASLVSMLEACEVAPAIHDPDLGFSRLPLGIDTHFIVDFELLPPGAVAFLSDLRRGGWQGAAILMTEQPLDAVWSLPARCWKIEKPFVAGDLLAIFRQIAP